MKAVNFIGRSIGSGLTRGYTYLRRRQDSESVDGPDRLRYELNSISDKEREGSSTSRSPSPLVERYATPEQDEVVYRKNNVLLKHPAGPKVESLVTGHIQTTSDNQLLIPGFLFVTTRGSNFGSTLILNWAPNSSMYVPGYQDTDGAVAIGNGVGTSEQGGGEGGAVAIGNGVGTSEQGGGEGGAVAIGNGVGTSEQGGGEGGAEGRGKGGEVGPVGGGLGDVREGEGGGEGVPNGGEGGVAAERIGKEGDIESAGRVLGHEEEGAGVGGEGDGGGESSLDSVRPLWSAVSIDLGVMEIVRVFYHLDESGFISTGELVVSSKEREFKVFYFRHGGLNDLIQLFRSWKYFNHQSNREMLQHTFTVIRPKLSLGELHPEEGAVTAVLTEEMWRSLMDAEGRIEDSRYVLKVVFFHGISPPLRREVWPFLLDLYRFSSTQKERERLRQKRLDDYWRLNERRLTLERDRGGKASRRNSYDLSAVHQIDKDVVRTDRSNPYYRGEENEHIAMLKNVLLNYLVYKPDISYSQGMTDLLAPLLAALDDEAEAFWCFTRLVEGSAFFKPARDHISVDRQLEPLRMLIKLLIPWFYSYLEHTEGGLSLMFCHRWLLVCLKREFSENDALCVWEACWTKYETPSFQLFICIAIMAIYGQRAVEKNMNINELMVFLNTLSQTMPRDIVLSQARGYLHQFCQSPEIHCSLYSVMHKEFWDRPGGPRLTCSYCRGDCDCLRTDITAGCQNLPVC